MPKFTDLTGQKFGRLTVLKRMDNDTWRASMWLCQCNCDDKNKIIVRGSSLKDSNTKSCGCLVTKHGHSKNRIYLTWNQMIQRCTNSNNKEYLNYGGREINVCKRWLKFENFYEDKGKDWKPWLTLERRDNKKGYYPNNCYWATRKQQARNRRNNLYITYNGKTQLLIKWSEETEIPYGTLYNRIYILKWSSQKALTIPVKKYKRKSS